MSSSNKRFSIFLILLVVFIDWMGIGLVYPMFSSMLFHTDFQMLPIETSDAVRGLYLGILLAMMPLAQFFSAPILGMISDRKGRKKLVIWSLAIGVVGYLIAVIGVSTENLPLLIVSRLIVGISAGSAAVVGAALADLSTPEEKAKNFGLLNMAAGVGFTVGPFLGGKLSEPFFGFQGGYEVPFLFAGVVVLINLILVQCCFKETYALKKEEKVSWALGLLQLKKAFQLKGLRALLVAVFLFSFGWSFFYEFIPVTWIHEYGFNASAVGDLYAYASAFYALSTGLLIRPIVSRVKPDKVLFYALIATGFYIFILLLHPEPFWLWVYLPLLQFLIAFLFPTSAAMISNWAPADMQGEILGVQQSIESIAFAISPLLAGALLGLHVDMPVIIGGVAMLAAALILGLSLRRSIKA